MPLRRAIDQFNADVRAMTQNASYRAKMEQLMIDPVSTTPAEFAELIKSDSARMGDIIKRARTSGAAPHARRRRSAQLDLHRDGVAAIDPVPDVENLAAAIERRT